MWQGKKVFLSSPTSFLGTWTALALKFQGAEVFGYEEAKPSSERTFFDLANLGSKISLSFSEAGDRNALRQVLEYAQADVVIHLAEVNHTEPYDILTRSVMGTAALLDLLRQTASVRSVVVVSSDKVYRVPAQQQSLSEEDPWGPREMGPAAKLCSELVALAYRHNYFNPEKYNKHKLALATLRVGSGIGGGDFAPKSLMYQCVQNFSAGLALDIRHPQSVRPWIHVLEQVGGILLAAEKLYEKGPKLASTYNLGACEVHSVASVIEAFHREWGAPGRTFGSPDTLTPSLHAVLNNKLAKKDLGWQPQWTLQQSLKLVADWFKAYEKGHLDQELHRQLTLYFGAGIQPTSSSV